MWCSDVSPEERVQNVGRILRKEVEDVTVRWKNVGAAAVDWQQQLELAMERLLELQDAQDQLDFKLRQAETVKNSWKPVGELLVDDLQNHIDRVKVSILLFLIKKAFSDKFNGNTPWSSMLVYPMVYMFNLQACWPKDIKVLCFFQAFQGEIAPIQDNVNQVNQLASTFRPPDIQLSPDNLRRIDDLNMRWRLLQVWSFN